MRQESSDVFTLEIEAAELPAPSPGQFFEVGLPGIGEAPISVSGTGEDTFSLTIRAVGALTEALTSLGQGLELGLRGPYGTPWPIDAIADSPVVLIAGGIGLAPLRTTLRTLLADSRCPDLQLFYGAREPDGLLYTDEIEALQEDPRFRAELTVDRGDTHWEGHVGVVTRLLRPACVPRDAHVLVCGPEVMMAFTVQALERCGVPHERIWLSMERHMECATRTCGRCQMGPFFVCHDGPVFRYDTIDFLFRADAY